MSEEKKHQDLFATTRWTLVINAGGDDSRQAAVALEELCRLYWFPLYAYVRGRGYAKEDAEDLVQGFFTSLLGRNDFSGLREKRGSFRAFLLASIKNYMANEYRKGQRIKRGGGAVHLSLDWEQAEARFDVMDTASKTPEEIFDRSWALALLQSVLNHLREEWREKGKEKEFELLKVFLMADKSDVMYRDVARKLGMEEGHTRVLAHRLRKKYREYLKKEITQTLSNPDLVEDELQVLRSVFS